MSGNVCDTCWCNLYVTDLFIIRQKMFSNLSVTLIQSHIFLHLKLYFWENFIHIWELSPYFWLESRCKLNHDHKGRTFKILAKHNFKPCSQSVTSLFSMLIMFWGSWYQNLKLGPWTKSLCIGKFGYWKTGSIFISKDLVQQRKRVSVSVLEHFFIRTVSKSCLRLPKL